MPPSDKQLRIWQIPGHDLRVEFHETFLEGLRVAARSQFTALSSSISIRRGLVLGTRVGMTVRPETSTTLDSTPAEWDASSVVGWYSLRTARDISLSKDDLDYFHRANADLLEIALIIRPTANDGIRIGVFFREREGAIRSASSYQELLVDGPAPSRHSRPHHRTSVDPETPNRPVDSSKRDQSSNAKAGLASIIGTFFVPLTNIGISPFRALQIAGYPVAPMPVDTKNTETLLSIVR